MWLTLGSNEKQREYDDGEVFEEMLDREKRDLMSQSGSMHDYFFIIFSKNTFLGTEMTENMSNDIYYISWQETLKKCRNRSSSIKCQI